MPERAVVGAVEQAYGRKHCGSEAGIDGGLRIASASASSTASTAFFATFAAACPYRHRQ
jgi:hypothetical protein